MASIDTPYVWDCRTECRQPVLILGVNESGGMYAFCVGCLAEIIHEGQYFMGDNITLIGTHNVTADTQAGFDDVADAEPNTRDEYYSSREAQDTYEALRDRVRGSGYRVDMAGAGDHNGHAMEVNFNNEWCCHTCKRVGIV